jgi:hypothetical protein
LAMLGDELENLRDELRTESIALNGTLKISIRPW